MQILTRRHMVVVEDYDHTKTINENVKWMKTNTSIVKFSSKP